MGKKQVCMCKAFLPALYLVSFELLQARYRALPPDMLRLYAKMPHFLYEQQYHAPH